jgi:hypothetical protein
VGGAGSFANILGRGRGDDGWPTCDRSGGASAGAGIGLAGSISISIELD